MKTTQFNVYDVIEIKSHIGRDLYQVIAIHIGALGQDSVIELMPMNQKTPNVYGKRTNCLVPLRMLESGIDNGSFNYTECPK